MSTALIPEGVRNVTLTSYAGSLRARGFDPQEILTSLRETNQRQCDPPLPDIEVRNISKSAAKWKPYPTRQGSQQQIVRIPRGCFDPRPAVCGFDAAAIVEGDTSLGLWKNHKALYAFLVGIFGPWGCHPSQATIAGTLRLSQQHVSRHVGRLERAGLILVEAGAYRAPEKQYACNSYHFVRHARFAEHFTRRGLPVFNDLADISHHLTDFSTGEGGTLHSFQQVTDYLTHRGVVVPITEQEPRSSTDCVNKEKDNDIHTAESPSTIHRALSDVEKKNRPTPYLVRTRAEIEPFDFEMDPDSDYNSTVRYRCLAEALG